MQAASITRGLEPNSYALFGENPNVLTVKLMVVDQLCLFLFNYFVI